MAQLSHHRAAVLSALASARGCTPEDVPEEDVPSPVKRVVLSNKAYAAAASEVLYNFFTRSTNGGVGSPSIASGVTELDMSDTIASLPEDEALQVLAQLSGAFEHANLAEVDLGDNDMGLKGINACRGALRCQTGSLERLSLCNMGLSSEAMEEVANILTGCGAGEASEGTDQDASAGDGAIVCERLTSLRFYNNMSGPGGCESFARILHRCTSTLTDIRFGMTRAGEEGSAVIAAALDELGDNVGNLRRLDLSDNTFREASSVVLCRALTRCGNLVRLNLRDCCLDDESEGTARVCHAIFGGSMELEHLDLSGNEMSSRGAESLADILDDLAGASLKVLAVEDNELSSLGVKKIARALYNAGIAAEEEGEAGCTLEHLQLGNTECGNIGARALLDAYRGGPGLPALVKIELDNNGFSADMVAELTAVFGGDEKLPVMDDNDEDAGFDDDVDSEGEDDGEDDGGGGAGDDDDNNVGREDTKPAAVAAATSTTNEDVHDLAERLAKGATISHDLV